MQVQFLSGRSPGGGNSNPFWYSCLENPMDRGGWWVTSVRSQRVRHNWARSTDSDALILDLAYFQLQCCPSVFCMPWFLFPSLPSGYVYISIPLLLWLYSSIYSCGSLCHKYLLLSLTSSFVFPQDCSSIKLSSNLLTHSLCPTFSVIFPSCLGVHPMSVFASTSSNCLWAPWG